MTRLCAATAGILLVLSVTVAVQDAEQFSGRLSVLPVDFATYRSLSGSGEARGALSGRLLEISGSFEGLSSPATVAHLHQAPRGRRGPVVFTLEVTAARDGEIGGQLDLDGDQVEALRDGELYVQIHTENNPEGELRGWLASVW